MGSLYHTSFARLLDGTKISIHDALKMLEKDSLRGKLQHISYDIPVKFVPSKTGKRENYFAVIGINDAQKKLLESCNESEVHKLSKEIFMDLSTFGIKDLVLDGRLISVGDIQGVSLEKSFTVGSRTLRPDIVLELGDINYFIEIKNTHGLTASKISRYKSLYKSISEGYPFKVIEVDVSDIANMSHSYSYDYIKDALVERLTSESNNKVVIDLSSEGRFIPFGRCFCCDSELELVNNVADPDKSTQRGLQNFKKVRLINPVASSNGDATALGSAVLHCPNCTESRYIQIFCPECLRKGYSVPLKLLYNPTCGGKKEQFILQCQRYISERDKMMEEKRIGHELDKDKVCDFCINILEEDGITPTDELVIVGGTSEMLKNWGRSKKRLLKLRDGIKQSNVN